MPFDFSPVDTDPVVLALVRAKARIRERLGKVLGGCAAVRENREPRDPAPFEPAMVNAGAFAPGGDHRAAELASGPHIHQALSTQPEGGE